MDLASVVAALASVGVRVSGSTPNNNVQVDSSRACPTGLAGPEPSGTINDPGQHFLLSDLRASVSFGVFLAHANVSSIRPETVENGESKCLVGLNRKMGLVQVD